MPRWIEITLRADGEAAEAAAELLARYGYQGVLIEPDALPPDAYDDLTPPPPDVLNIRAYLPEDERAPDIRAQLEQGLAYLNMIYPMPQPTYRMVDEEDWAEAWKAHYHPLRLGKRLLIRPAWTQVAAEPGQVVIALDPGMAFGTGTHPTTQLCLEAVEDTVTPGAHVLDLGCGSGILAIAAIKLGAGSALAVDIDPIAVEATRRNAEENDAPRIETRAGSLDAIAADEQFDLLLANILAPVIIRLCEEGLARVVSPGGTAVFSGIIREQAGAVEEALRAAGLTPTEQRWQGDWLAILAQRPA